MPIESREVSDGLRHISITGRLDVPGADAIASKFATLSSDANLRVVVDLSGVLFLGSSGIRLIILNAKTLQQQGGKMVLLVGDNEAIARTLHATGVDSLVPILADSAAAEAAALA
jgi:anti-anti-sigma factor